MHLALGIQEHIVGLDVSMDDALLVDVPYSAAELCYPETHCLLCEGLSRNVKAQVTAVHEVDDNVAGFG